MDSNGYEYDAGEWCFVLKRDGRIVAAVKFGPCTEYDVAHTFDANTTCIYAAELFLEDFERENIPYTPFDDLLTAPRKWCEKKLEDG